MKELFSKLVLISFVLAISSSVAGQAESEKDTESAVAVLRNVSSKGRSEEQMELKSKDIDAAWKKLIAAGAPAAERLKREIEKVDAAKEKDDFFKLNATVVIWQIGKTDEAEYVAKVWSSTPVQAQYTYVFYTAFEAAQLQDPKVLPMLRAVLKDDQGSIYVGAHAMSVAWPLSHEFIWGAFGPAGLPQLLEIAEGQSTEVEIKSAVRLLAKAQYLPALPRLRDLMADDRIAVRQAAIQAVGEFGHPADFDRLIAGLKSTDPREQFSYAYALYEFEDERAVPHILPLLESKDQNVMVESYLALLHLLTPESWNAVKAAIEKVANPEAKAFLKRSISLREEKLPKNFNTLSAEQQRLALVKVRDADSTIDPSKPGVSNKQLVDALKVWKTKGRIYDSGVVWPGQARMIAAATPDNIELILQTKAAIYKRLSDECLYEVRDLDKTVKYVGRNRYRKGMGVTAKADLK